jgi:hypothetical protein
MTWKCFGWDGAYCHTGTDYFASDRDGLCVEDHDIDYDPPAYPFSIHFVVLNPPSKYNLGRKIVSFFEGVEFDRFYISNSWAWAHVSTTLDHWYNEGRYRYELQDNNGKVICKREVFTGEITEEAPVIDDPPVSDIDYDKIVEGTALIVNTGMLKTVGEINQNQNLINGVQNSVDDMNTGLNSQIEGVGNDITNGIDELSDNINGSIQSHTLSFVKGISDLADRVSSIKVPNIADIKYAFMDVCSDLAKALWDSILAKIEERYPDDDEESD